MSNDGKKISYDDLYDYISNNLDGKRMLEVEKNIVDNKESEDVFHMMMFDYQCEKDYIDSLIGEDPENNEIFFDQNRPNSENQTLYGKDKQKNLIMDTKNFKGLPENFEAVKQVVEDLTPSIEKMIAEGGRENYEMYAQELIQEHCGKPKETAKEIVDDLLSGIAEFDSQYESLKTHDSVNVSDILGDKSDSEKKNIVINFLVMLKAFEAGKNFSEKEIESFYNEYDKQDLESLLPELNDTIMKNGIVDEIIGKMAYEEELTPEEIAQFKELVEKNTPENKRLQKFYTALALYLATYDEKIDLSVDGNRIEPKTIGACAGAAVEFSSVTADLAAGNVDLPTWAKWVKYIFAGLLIVSFIVATGIIISFAGIGLMVVLMAMFGQGVLSTLIAFAIAIPVIKVLVDKTVEFGGWLLEKLEQPYENAIKKLVSVVGWAASFAKGQIDKVRARITKEYGSENKTEATASVMNENKETETVSDEQQTSSAQEKAENEYSDSGKKNSRTETDLNFDLAY